MYNEAATVDSQNNETMFPVCTTGATGYKQSGMDDRSRPPFLDGPTQKEREELLDEVNRRLWFDLGSTNVDLRMYTGYRLWQRSFFINADSDLIRRITIAIQRYKDERKGMKDHLVNADEYDHSRGWIDTMWWYAGYGDAEDENLVCDEYEKSTEDSTQGDTQVGRWQDKNGVWHDDYTQLVTEEDEERRLSPQLLPRALEPEQSPKETLLPPLETGPNGGVVATIRPNAEAVGSSIMSNPQQLVGNASLNSKNATRITVVRVNRHGRRILRTPFEWFPPALFQTGTKQDIFQYVYNRLDLQMSVSEGLGIVSKKRGGNIDYNVRQVLRNLKEISKRFKRTIWNPLQPDEIKTVNRCVGCLQLLGTNSAMCDGFQLTTKKEFNLEAYPGELIIWREGTHYERDEDSVRRNRKLKEEHDKEVEFMEREKAKGIEVHGVDEPVYEDEDMLVSYTWASPIGHPELVGPLDVADLTCGTCTRLMITFWRRSNDVGIDITMPNPDSMMPGYSGKNHLQDNSAERLPVVPSPNASKGSTVSGNMSSSAKYNASQANKSVVLSMNTTQSSMNTANSMNTWNRSNNLASNPADRSINALDRSRLASDGDGSEDEGRASVDIENEMYDPDWPPLSTSEEAELYAWYVLTNPKIFYWSYCASLVAMLAILGAITVLAVPFGCYLVGVFGHVHGAMYGAIGSILLIIGVGSSFFFFVTVIVTSSWTLTQNSVRKWEVREKAKMWKKLGVVDYEALLTMVDLNDYTRKRWAEKNKLMQQERNRKLRQEQEMRKQGSLTQISDESPKGKKSANKSSNSAASGAVGAPILATSNVTSPPSSTPTSPYTPLVAVSTFMPDQALASIPEIDGPNSGASTVNLDLAGDKSGSGDRFPTATAASLSDSSLIVDGNVPAQVDSGYDSFVLNPSDSAQTSHDTGSSQTFAVIGGNNVPVVGVKDGDSVPNMGTIIGQAEQVGTVTINSSGSPIHSGSIEYGEVIPSPGGPDDSSPKSHVIIKSDIEEYEFPNSNVDSVGDSGLQTIKPKRGVFTSIMGGDDNTSLYSGGKNLSNGSRIDDAIREAGGRSNKGPSSKLFDLSTGAAGSNTAGYGATVGGRGGRNRAEMTIGDARKMIDNLVNPKLSLTRKILHLRPHAIDLFEARIHGWKDTYGKIAFSENQ